MTEHDSDRFEDSTRDLLNESTEQLDAATLSKLHRARNKALENTTRNLPWIGWASGGAVAAGVMLFGIYLYQMPPPLPEIYADPIQQATVENMELLDDLEFLALLVLEEVQPEDAASSS